MGRPCSSDAVRSRTATSVPAGASTTRRIPPSQDWRISSTRRSTNSRRSVAVAGSLLARQKELIGELNKRLTDKHVTTYDMQAIRARHDINAETQPDFCHHPKYGSAQYSDAFLDWIVAQYEAEREFFEEARRYYYNLHHT